MDEEAKTKLFILTFILLSIAVNGIAATILRGWCQLFVVGYAIAVLSNLFGAAVVLMIKGVDEYVDKETSRLFTLVTIATAAATSAAVMMVVHGYVSVYLLGFVLAIITALASAKLVEWASKDEDE